MKTDRKTICSISTPQGVGAIAVIRISGDEAFTIAAKLFPTSFSFLKLKENVCKYAEVFENERLIDQVMVVKFKAPHSYSGEDMVEISCHGSFYIQKKIIELLLSMAVFGYARRVYHRAFLNGKWFAQAEAVPI